MPKERRLFLIEAIASKSWFEIDPNPVENELLEGLEAYFDSSDVEFKVTAHLGDVLVKEEG